LPRGERREDVPDDLPVVGVGEVVVRWRGPDGSAGREHGPPVMSDRPTRFRPERTLWGVKVHDVVMAGPRDAVERVWRDDGPRLWRSLVAFGGDAELASDAMAEAFAQALGRGDQVETPDR
jgi:hypothetical protein